MRGRISPLVLSPPSPRCCSCAFQLGPLKSGRQCRNGKEIQEVSGGGQGGLGMY